MQDWMLESFTARKVDRSLGTHRKRKADSQDWLSHPGLPFAAFSVNGSLGSVLTVHRGHIVSEKRTARIGCPTQACPLLRSVWTVRLDPCWPFAGDTSWAKSGQPGLAVPPRIALCCVQR